MATLASAVPEIKLTTDSRLVQQKVYKNSSGDEIANVNVL